VYLKRELGVNQASSPATSSAVRLELLDFVQAREKHRQWLGRLTQVLEGKLTLTQEQAGSPRDCALGKWLYSTGIEQYGDIAAMQTLEATHRKFHETVREVVLLKQAGDSGAERAFGTVEVLSKDVIELLTLVEQKVAEAQNVNIVVLRADDRQFGLVVDEINDSEEIVVKPLGKQLKGLSCYAGACIMGDGRVALILDVMGLAQQANVIDEARARSVAEENRQAIADASKQTFLLFAGPDDSRMAVPLATVARLEELPVTDAETAGTQWVTQYRGQILPLVNLEVALTERRRKKREKPAQASNAPLQVVVCNHEGRLVGLMVERILDIVKDTAELKYPPTRAGVLHSAVIQGKVTELLDIPALLRASGVESGNLLQPVVRSPEVTT
jgi:chemotaxis signal transduction protein